MPLSAARYSTSVCASLGGEDHPHKASGEAEQHHLGCPQAHDIAHARTQHETNADVRAVRRQPREKQQRQTCTGNREDDPPNGQEPGNEDGDAGRHRSFPQTGTNLENPRTAVARRVRVTRTRFRIGFRERHTRAQAAEEFTRGQDSRRNPHIRSDEIDPLERAGDDPDDDGGLSRDEDGTAERVRVTGEHRAPPSLADARRRNAGRAVIFGAEQTSGERLRAERRKVGRAHGFDMRRSRHVRHANGGVRRSMSHDPARVTRVGRPAPGRSDPLADPFASRPRGT